MFVPSLPDILDTLTYILDHPSVKILNGRCQGLFALWVLLVSIVSIHGSPLFDVMSLQICFDYEEPQESNGQLYLRMAKNSGIPVFQSAQVVVFLREIRSTREETSF